MKRIAAIAFSLLFAIAPVIAVCGPAPAPPSDECACACENHACCAETPTAPAEDQPAAPVSGSERQLSPAPALVPTVALPSPKISPISFSAPQSLALKASAAPLFVWNCAYLT